MPQDNHWQMRYHLSQINWAKIATNEPTRGLISGNQTGKFQLYAWDVQSGDLRQLIDRGAGQRSGSIAPNGRWIYFLEDQQGNERGHYIRVPFAGGEAEDITPDLPPYFSYGLTHSRAGNWIGLSIVDEAGSHIQLLEVDVEGKIGERRPLYQSKQMAFHPTFSSDGERVVIASTEATGKPQYALLAFNCNDGQQIGELWDGDGANMKSCAFAPQPGDNWLLASTNVSGFERPLIWNVATRERTDLTLPELIGNVEPVAWSPDGTQLLLCHIHQAVQQLYRYDLARATLTKLHHPPGFYAAGPSTCFYAQGEIWIVWEDASHPPQLIALDATTGAYQRKVLVAAEAIAGHALRSITLPSSDGQMVQGWLGVPAGEGPFPTVISLHGGPEMAVMNWFDPESQAWLDDGFAFLSLNYRGSTTFGNAFQTMIWVNIGHWEVEDLVAARTWLVAEGIARPEQIFLTGWSYGGYLTLLGLGKHPNLWAGELAGAAIADWALLYEDAAESLLGHTVLAMGGTPDEVPEQYAASSPFTYIERIAAPVLIIQGQNDSRTPARQVALFAERMRALGKPIELVWYETGHVGGDMAMAAAHQALMIDYARQVVGAID